MSAVIITSWRGLPSIFVPSIFVPSIFVPSIFVPSIFASPSIQLFIVDVDADFRIDRGRGWISNVHYG
jgi:hypothetical protein